MFFHYILVQNYAVQEDNCVITNHISYRETPPPTPELLHVKVYYIVPQCMKCTKLWLQDGTVLDIWLLRLNSNGSKVMWFPRSSCTRMIYISHACKKGQCTQSSSVPCLGSKRTFVCVVQENSQDMVRRTENERTDIRMDRRCTV